MTNEARATVGTVLSFAWPIFSAKCIVTRIQIATAMKFIQPLFAVVKIGVNDSRNDNPGTFAREM